MKRLGTDIDNIEEDAIPRGIAICKRSIEKYIANIESTFIRIKWQEGNIHGG